MARRLGVAIASVPWWLWAITLLALVLRLVPVGYGLPFEFDPDENLFVDAGWRMIEGGDLDPGWYGFPASTLLDVIAMAYAAYAAVGLLSGSFASLEEVTAAHYADVSHFYMIARAVVAVSGVAVVLAAYAVARAIHAPRFWAAVVALMLTVSWPFVHYSSIVRADMLQTLFMLLIVYASIRVLDRPRWTTFAVAGVLLGLSATSKYPGAVGLATILASNITLVALKRITPRQGWLWLFAAGAAGLATVLIVAPYLLLHFGETVNAIRHEAGAAHFGAEGQGFLANLWKYLTTALPWSLGEIGSVLGMVGLGIMLAYRRPRLVSVTFAAYLVALAMLALWWLRWSLPLVPLVAIGAIFVSWRLESWVTRSRPRTWRLTTRAVLSLVLIVPLLGPTLSHVIDRAGDADTRVMAVDWVHDNLPEGTTLLIDSGTTQLRSDRYDLVIVTPSSLARWSDINERLRPGGYFGSIGGFWHGTAQGLVEAIEANDVDYVVVNPMWLRLLREEGDAYAAQVENYEAVLAEYPKVVGFSRSDAPLGPEVIILHSGEDTTAE